MAPKIPDSLRESPIHRVWATPAAIDAIIHLRAALGYGLCFRLEHGSGDGDEVRLVRASTPARLGDVALGTVGGAPLFVDWDEYKAWGCPEFRVNVSAPELSNHDGGVSAHYHLVSERVDEEPESESDVDQVVIEGVAGELGSTAEAELLLDVGAVGLDRAHA